jgi:dimethylaniline monooxygenase (N-oxide forming)
MSSDDNNNNKKKKERSYCVVGSGWAGVCAVRSLLEEGVLRENITVFEKSSRLGGHWSLGDDDASGVYSDLTTNTTSFTNCVGDVPPMRCGVGSVHNTAQEMRDYVDRLWYLTGMKKDGQGLRLRAEVQSVEPLPRGGYGVTWLDRSKSPPREMREDFDAAVLAMSRQNKPSKPEFPGLDQFPGKVMHAMSYRRSTEFRGKRVLIIGCALSGPEVAGDLAASPQSSRPARVVVISRGDVPRLRLKEHPTLGSSFTDVNINRFNYMLGASGVVPPEEMEKQIIGAFDAFGGTNEDLGLPSAQSRFAGGYPVSRTFFDGIKSGLVEVKKAQVETFLPDGRVRYVETCVDGPFDAVILATGYDVCVDCLPPRVRDLVLAPDDPKRHMDLYRMTFHPDLPDLAFQLMGWYNMGSIPVTADMQGRYAAAVLTGRLKLPSKEDMNAGIEEWRSFRRGPAFNGFCDYTALSDMWAADLGCMPDPRKYPDLTAFFLFGPCVAAQYRIEAAADEEESKRALWQVRRFCSLAGFDSNRAPAPVRDLILAAERSISSKSPNAVLLQGLKEACGSMSFPPVDQIPPPSS